MSAKKAIRETSAYKKYLSHYETHVSDMDKLMFDINSYIIERQSAKRQFFSRYHLNNIIEYLNVISYMSDKYDIDLNDILIILVLWKQGNDRLPVCQLNQFRFVYERIKPERLDKVLLKLKKQDIVYKSKILGKEYLYLSEHGIQLIKNISKYLSHRTNFIDLTDIVPLPE